MKKSVLTQTIHSLLGASTLGAGLLLAPNMASAESFTEALTGGKPTVDIRVRYEGVSQETKDDASAFTVRSRIGYLTGDYKGFNGFIEMSDTSALGDRKDYFAPGPYGGGDSTKATVLDPTFTNLNQAWIGYKNGSTSLKVGRQRIIMDTRFLGNVGWRQNEQIYSGASLNTKAIPSTELSYAYINNVNNPVGADIEMDSHAAKLDFSGIPFGKLTAYGYFLDYETGTDSQTLGARLAGKTKLKENMNLIYHLEYASQDDYADSDNIGGDYTRGEIGLGLGKVTVLAGQEKLGGDGTSSFQTPLGTVHLYNGWADMFIGPVGGTPVNGLVDNYLKVSGKALGMKLAAAYHDFSSDKGSINYGTEYNLLAAKKFNKTYTAGIKYASYTADEYAQDTDKLWIWGEAKF
ncbi:alginate export family protein [Thiomicrorhabdus sp. zzn3]|uniref:alginate export family protein n=1 Tax=Thiomicrorhabdus sp. zzn3 TaxID=3039775 RepID=UPI0024369E80|nr:alginate export family protein [Thiomicrorhabdus sp. zzn3]MDG6778311.1 alginate export family protein [Thiomicrorhabdus sp. zzn3]